MALFPATLRALAPVALATLALTASLDARAISFVENFNPGGTGPNSLPATWTPVNLSVPLGTNTVGWASGGAPIAFGAQDGSTGNFAYANFNAGAGVATISDWLYTPTLTLDAPATLAFWTRAAGTFPDGLEVRWSSAATPSVGTTATSVGTFTTLLLAINPTLTTTGYPTTWTRYSVDLSSLGLVSGNIAFRYYVTNGGPTGANSNFIGIDTVSVTSVPEPTTLAMLGLGLGALAWRRRAANA